jgi:aminoglycoside 3-N-acetyltransferase
MVFKEHSKLDKIETDQLEAELKKMGISEGDHVAVALSFKSIGFVNGGPDALIDALIDTIGSKGTIMMNAHTNYFPISEIDPNFIFDNETVPLTGIVPQKLLKRKGSIRSRHPMFSVVAIGHLAGYLTEGHDECSNPYLPLEKLAQIGGKCLFIGIEGRLVAVRHEAQRRAGLFAVPMFTGVQYKNKEGKTKLFVTVNPACTSRLPEFIPKFEKMQILKRGKIGMAPSIIGPAGKIIDSMSMMLKNDPTLNLCDSIYCIHCRELERQLDLYKKIENPRYFQKSRLLRRFISFRNKLTLSSRYSYISFSTSPKKRKFSPVIFMDAIISLVAAFFSKILR